MYDRRLMRPVIHTLYICIPAFDNHQNRVILEFYHHRFRLLSKYRYWQAVAGFSGLQIFVITSTYLDFGDFFDTNMISKVSDSVFFVHFLEGKIHA